MIETLTGSYGDGLPFSRESELAVLASRLEQGWEIIEERVRSGKDVSELESHWLNLLAEYESTYESLNHASVTHR